MADDVEKVDLMDEELRQIEMEELGSEPPSKAKKSYAGATTKVRHYEVLYIHQGKKERDPISRENFYKLWDLVAYKVLMEDMTGSKPHNIIWRSWSNNRGLIAVGDKETADVVMKKINETTIMSPDKKENIGFKAWHRGEFGETYLVTGWLKGSHFKKFRGEQLMNIVINYNKLKGKANVKITDSEEGCLMRFFADPEMWADLLQQRKDKHRLGPNRLQSIYEKKANRKNFWGG